MRTLLFGGDVITPDGMMTDWSLLVDGPTIFAVGPRRMLQRTIGIERRIDVAGRIIAPGFIDLQINGAAGHLLTSEPTVETLRAMANVLPRFGCTAFLPTVITAPLEQIERAAGAVATAMTETVSGARILGTHLEGPFINPERAGAHRPEFIVPPSVDILERLWNRGGRSAVLLTLAPEQPGADEVIDAARQLGITVSIGHSNANLAQIDRAVRHGATLDASVQRNGATRQSPTRHRRRGTIP